jgi:hypothetical protein
MRLLLIIAVYLLDKHIFQEEGMERKRFQAKQWFINILLLGAVLMLLTCNGCSSAMQIVYSTDQNFRLEKETEAYCESIAKVVLNRKDVIRQTIPVIYENHGKPYSFAQVEIYVRKVCDEMERRFNAQPP